MRPLRPGRTFRSEPPRHRWPLVWFLSFATWTVVWAVLSSQGYVYYRGRGLSFPWPRYAGLLADFLLWAVFTPAALWFIWRAPLCRSTWQRRLPVQVLVGVAVTGVYTAFDLLVRGALAHLLAEPDLAPPPSPGLFFRLFVTHVFAYVDVALVGHAVHYARDARAKELRTSQLEAGLAEAQLQVLRMQLHPHFLFNTLHTVSALMHKDVRAADRMLALLGDLLRDSFDKLGAQEVSLKQELGFLDRYLEIERTRFQDRLRVELDVAPEVLDAVVPNLLLQPLVENAVRHGAARREGSSRVQVVGYEREGWLELRIRDDGPGLPGEEELQRRGGVGLANTQARLEQTFGKEHRFEVRNRPEGGVEVALALPLSLRPAEEPAEAVPPPVPAPHGPPRPEVSSSPAVP